ncbi:hypothetical protein HYH02_007251 [Chlamydomonas schloesseri]|uniref:Peroxisome biogenesis protein 22 n=1 Tax=Chlamydomonas schloesseri TaxID=2026947 RepID=A0A835WHQ1_9CHLO|nr:hypothetical protein HYH02_007251 [Chlamydomonas schloesseri]|eukprot:KAG2447794.1 hypothetical protein HYH02_007251 [Chlamydomonas schloesseri]
MASGLAALYNKLVQLLQTAPRGALSITGILGLALIVYGYLQLRDNSRAEQQRREQQARERQRLAGTPAGGSAGAAPRASSAAGPAPAAAAPVARAGLAPAASPAPSPAPAPRTSAGASATPLGRAVAAQLAGAKRVTISIPGVLLAECTPAQLQESASVRPEVAEAVREMARVSDVYLLAHVEDDVGEAVVAGSLEAAGLLGPGPGQVAAHHLLCCSTLDGKVPIVRQLDPDLHVDGHVVSVDELKRFLPRLLLVREEGSGSSASGGSGNVGLAPSLRAFFGA